MRTTKSRIGLRYLQLTLVTFSLIAAVLTVLAQGITAVSSRGLTSGDGSIVIRGRVLFPPIQSGVPIKVNLESSGSSFGSWSAVTDQDGAFRFNAIRAGTYSVV